VRKLTPNGELKRSFYLKSGMKHGEEVEYFLSSEWEGAPDHPKYKLSIYWVENRIHGCVKTWYNQGQLHSQREYLRNQRVGPSLAWYLDGSLMLYEEYEEDRLLTGQYYKLQKKEPISSVAKGTGIATLFDERGSFLRKVNYVKGKPVDPED
jgi:antitoxin component YwqK of YwqJK toxin-antitoxin module